MLIKNILIKGSEAVLFCDEDRLILPYDQFLREELKEGDELPAEKARKIIGLSTAYLCRKKAMNYLAASAKTSFQVKRYLIRKGFDKNTVESVLEYLIEKKYVDDRSFALRLAERFSEAKNMGRNLIRKKLIEKGLARDIVDEAMSNIPVIEDANAVYELALKKVKQIKNKKNPESKTAYFLTSKGFSGRAVREALNHLKREGFFEPPDED